MNLVNRSISNTQEYSITSLVYSGAFSTLYSGTWERLGQTIHVSVEHGVQSLELTSRAASRIQQNMLTNVGRIQHANLPDVVDFGEGDEIPPFSIMRLPPGKLLLHRLSEARLGTLETFHIIADVAAALQACRAAGLPHRGPTADRVWVCDDGRAILLGLGAVLYRPDSYRMHGRESIELLWHLPPEAFLTPDELGEGEDLVAPPSYRQQIGNDETRGCEETEAAEVFSLGTLAFHCVMGHHPFFSREGGTTQGISALKANARVELDQPTLRSAVDIALSPDPEKRFPHVADLVNEIRRALRLPADLRSGTGVRAAAPPTASPASPAAKTPRRRGSSEARPENETVGGSVTLWRGLSALLLIALIAYAYLDVRRPFTMLITSTPAGLELEEVTGHLVESRGRTPVVLRGRDRNALITLHAKGPNGEDGPDLTLNPAGFQDLGRCKRVHLDAEFTADDGEGEASD